MATSVERKISSDVSADIPSAESLSFQSLVCVQNQPPSKPQIGHVLPLPPTKHDPEFVFCHATTQGIAVVSSNKISPADLLFSNGQILPQAIRSHSQVVSRVSSKELLPPTRRSSSDSSRRSSDNQLGFNKAAKKTNKEVIRSQGSWSFGQKIFKSLSAPCRGCRAAHALEPSRSMKIQTLRQEIMKPH